jgi:hypothetical protein
VAIEDYGTDWVLEHYDKHNCAPERPMEMPEKDDLPFYEADGHDVTAEEEQGRGHDA